VTATATYEGFGGTVATTGSTGSAYGFAATSGYRYDADAGLTQVGARYYDAQVGRFTTRGESLNEHPYLYCEQNPVNIAEAVEPGLGDELIGSVKGVIGKIGVVGCVGGIVEEITPPGSIPHIIGATIAGFGIATVGVALVASAAAATAPVAIVGGAIVGTAVAVYGAYHAIRSWFE
jgi:RHS repeat-associated protein